MPATATLQEMRDRTRRLAHLEFSPASTGVASNTIVDEALNRNLKQLYDKLRIARPKGFYQRTKSWSLTAAEPYYPLPDDFLELIAVWGTDSGGSTVVPIEDFLPQEIPDLLALEQGNAGTLYSMRYGIVQDEVGLRLELRPAPASTGLLLHIRYCPAFVPLPGANADAESFDGVNGWEDWACYRAAMDLLNREESDISGLMAMWQVLDANIAALAGNRDMGRPWRIQDVERDHTVRRRRYP